MRNLMLVCAGLAVVAGIVSVNLWLELRAERQINAQWRAQSALPQATPGLVSAAAHPEPDQPVAAPPRAEAPAAGASAATNAPPRPVNPAFSIAEMLKDPAYRAAALAQMRGSLPQSYPGLVEELGLTPEEADKLFDLLAESSLTMTATMPTTGGGRSNAEVAQEFARVQQELQRKQEESIASLLGAGRYGQWQEYQESRPGRLQTVQVGRAMEVQGQPLSAEQSRYLTAAFTAEQKRQREELQGQNPGFAVDDPPLAQVQMQEESLRRQAERNRRIVEAAASQLTVRQLETLRTMLEQQLTIGQGAARMMRQQLEAQRQSSGEPSGAGSTTSAF